MLPASTLAYTHCLASLPGKSHTSVPPLPWCQDAAAVQHFIGCAKATLAPGPVEDLTQQTQHIGTELRSCLQKVTDPGAMRFYADLHVLLELRIQGVRRQREDLSLLLNWVETAQGAAPEVPVSEPCNLCLHAVHLQRDLQAYGREIHLTQCVLGRLSAMIPSSPKL